MTLISKDIRLTKLKGDVGVDEGDNSSDCDEDLAKTEAVLVAAYNKHTGEIISNQHEQTAMATPPAGSDLHLGSTASSAMKNNHDEEVYYSIQNSSKPKPSNKTGRNEDTFQRNHLLNHDKAQCSALKDYKSDSLKKKYLNNSSELIPKKIYRNLGEHFLFEDVEHSQSIKSFCFTSNTDTNYINEEDNITISTGNDKYYTQKHLNNGRNTTKVTIKESFSNKINNNKIANMLTSNSKFYEDKTTYCRPILNYYNQQFLYKTMERNTKLKNLVKKLTLARQREREKVNWNNFINELKNRHRYEHEDDLLEEYVTPEIINDDDNTILSWQKSTLGRNILRDFYGAYDTLQPNRIHEQHQEPQKHIQYLPCNTNSYCYPTSSMGRIIMFRRDQEKYKLLKCKTEEAQKICNCEGDADDLTYKSCVSNLHGNKDIRIHFKNIKSTLVQADNKVLPPIIENLKKDKAISNGELFFSTKSNETNTVDKLIKLENINNSSLANIENKLEYLIESINSFIIQIKSQKRSNHDSKCKTVPHKTSEEIIGNLNMTKSDSLGMTVKENKVLGEVTVSNSGSTVSTANRSPSDVYNSINKILKDIETYSKVDFQNEHKNKLNKPCCSVQILVEVPTKDCCTEVTKSLSKQKHGDEVTTIKEIIIPKTSSTQDKMLPIQRMTIAVNTDPLSLLALLRFSTETIKRLMSYLPNFDYVSYLSALGFLQTWRSTENSYICKICGNVFDSPTKLSDHIHGHNLGKTRDCCVCRHDLERTRKSLFSCQYCGQHFTRAYCCELHQQSCAKRLGICHNAASSLMLLR